MPTRLLAGQGHDITVFYANSNIAPRAEYEKRLVELQRYAAANGFPVIEGNYDPAAWEREVAPIGEAIKDFSPALASRLAGEDASAPQAASQAILPEVSQAAPRDIPQAAPLAAPQATPLVAPQTVAELLDDERRRERCRACYRLRLEEAAAVAAQGGYEGLATTLAVSPYQFTDVIRDELQRAAAGAGIAAHFEDYRPYYHEATRISRELGMYRQGYCGCRFSVPEAEATRAFIKAQRKADKAAKAAAKQP